MTDYDYNRDDPTFVEDLRNSLPAVEAVARYFRSMGLEVTVPPLRIRPDPSQMGDYADEGDLKVTARVEVKHRPRLNFTGIEDFPYETIIVDACHCYENANPRPVIYVILNANITGGFRVDVRRTKAHWTRRTTYDKAKGRKREFFYCPVGLLQYIEMPPPQA